MQRNDLEPDVVEPRNQWIVTLVVPDLLFVHFPFRLQRFIWFEMSCVSASVSQ